MAIGFTAVGGLLQASSVRRPTVNVAGFPGGLLEVLGRVTSQRAVDVELGTSVA